MRSRAPSILRAILSLIVCSATLITKKLTDNQADQVFKRNQKLSNEWTLLNRISWTQEANDFSIITFGGYTLISATILLTRILKPSYHIELCEKIFLIFGIILFLIQGFLVYATTEYIPGDIQVGAYILGSLCILAALFFLMDIYCIPTPRSFLIKSVQTEAEFVRPSYPSTIITDCSNVGKSRENCTGKVCLIATRLSEAGDASSSHHVSFDTARKFFQTHV